MKVRFYLVEKDRIRKIGVDSNMKRKFPGLENTNQTLMIIIFEENQINRVELSNIVFNEDGQWDIDREQMKLKIKNFDILGNKKKYPKIDFKPTLTTKQLDLIKHKVVNDFGIHFWQQIITHI